MADSGGLQEEATASGIPCLTLRENTKKPITITEEINELMDTSKEKIGRLLKNYTRQMEDWPNTQVLRWQTTERILEIIEN